MPKVSIIQPSDSRHKIHINMATINIELAKKNSRKEYPVSYIVRVDNTKKRIPTGITLDESQVTAGGKIRECRIKTLLERKRLELQERLDELSLELLGRTDIDAAYLADRLLANPGGLDFFAFADEWLENTTIKGTKNYKAMLASLEKFLGRRSLPFERIDFRLLSEYERHLKDRPRAQSLYLGEMRHLYREAMRTYNTDRDQVIKNDPFSRYRCPKQVMKKGVRALTLEQLHKIYDYKGSGRAMLARDCFILSFCLMGINSVDMYELKDYANGRIKYKRMKTKNRRSDEAYIEVDVHPFIIPIMEKRRGDKRVFNFSERYADASNFNKAINAGLKLVGKATGIANLTFYQARHTFATLSRNLMKFSKSDVDEALNHIGSHEIADVYIAKDFSIINENNFRLIENVFKKPLLSSQTAKGNI